MSAADAFARLLEDEVEQAQRPADEVPLGPGIRIVDGRPMYSAAWLDFEAPRAA
jgi:hypothetical protein